LSPVERVVRFLLNCKLLVVSWIERKDMPNGFPMNWEDSSIIQDKSGKAVFWIDEHKYEMELPTLHHANAIKKMIDHAFSTGRSFGAESMKSRVARELEESF
jgi:hypothetical protein